MAPEAGEELEALVATWASGTRSGAASNGWPAKERGTSAMTPLARSILLVVCWWGDEPKMETGEPDPRTDGNALTRAGSPGELRLQATPTMGVSPKVMEMVPRVPSTCPANAHHMHVLKTSVVEGTQKMDLAQP